MICSRSSGKELGPVPPTMVWNRHRTQAAATDFYWEGGQRQQVLDSQRLLSLKLCVCMCLERDSIPAQLRTCLQSGWRSLQTVFALQPQWSHSNTDPVMPGSCWTSCEVTSQLLHVAEKSLHEGAPAYLMSQDWALCSTSQNPSSAPHELCKLGWITQFPSTSTLCLYKRGMIFYLSHQANRRIRWHQSSKLHVTHTITPSNRTGAVSLPW